MPIVAQRIPTLFLTGEDDLLIPPRLVERVARQIPHAQVVTIPASGHSPYFEKPDDWNRIVLDFLQG